MRDEYIRLIERQRPDWSLEQAFYTSEELFRFERQDWLSRQWYVIGHRSEISEVGSYIVREILGESLIIVRNAEGGLAGFYNVCRHRGSKICRSDGRGKFLVCPYHAWCYRLDGSLRAAAALPTGIDTAELSLLPVPVYEIGGVILGSLTGRPDELDGVTASIAAMLDYHGIADARIVARRSYPTHANWKLVIENFIECYHCLPAHPEYSSVMRHIDAVGRDAPSAAAAWQDKVREWFRTEADPNSPLTPEVLQSDLDPTVCRIFREPIGAGRKTQSQDGEPVAPLLGALSRFDGGYSGFGLRPFVALVILNDHAVLFRMMPVAAEETEVELMWLVAGTSSDSDVDLPRMIWLWDVTTTQDKTLIEQNAAGIRSRSYSPGPYSTLEAMPAAFVSRYLREMRSTVAARAE